MYLRHVHYASLIAIGLGTIHRIIGWSIAGKDFSIGKVTGRSNHPEFLGSASRTFGTTTKKLQRCIDIEGRRTLRTRQKARGPINLLRTMPKASVTLCLR
jgi:hypothetical protein